MRTVTALRLPSPRPGLVPWRKGTLPADARVSANVAVNNYYFPSSHGPSSSFPSIKILFQHCLFLFYFFSPASGNFLLLSFIVLVSRFSCLCFYNCIYIFVSSPRLISNNIIRVRALEGKKRRAPSRFEWQRKNETTSGPSKAPTAQTSWFPNEFMVSWFTYSHLHVAPSLLPSFETVIKYVFSSLLFFLPSINSPVS